MDIEGTWRLDVDVAAANHAVGPMTVPMGWNGSGKIWRTAQRLHFFSHASEIFIDMPSSITTMAMAMGCPMILRALQVEDLS